MKTLVCIIVMLTVLPIVAVTGLITFDPKNWGGPPTIQNILTMAFFGLITVPLWLTYIPALILTPQIMSKIASYSSFYSISLLRFVITALIGGAIGGVLILSPCIVMALSVSVKLVLNWLWAGAISGAITFTIISLIYRKMGS